MSLFRAIVGRLAVPLAIALALVSAGCGKKGPLYLPDPAPAATVDQEDR